MDQEEIKRTRQNFVVSIRKANREEQFAQKRKRITQNCQHQKGIRRVTIVDQRYREAIQKYCSVNYQLSNLSWYCSKVLSQNIFEVHEAIIAIRKIVSEIESQDSTQKVIDSGIVPTLIRFMRQQNYPQLQFESCWTITNIASGSNVQCESIVDKGCIDVFLQLLYEGKPFILQQTLWGIGNIAGDCAKFRDMILVKGGHQCLLRIIQNSKQPNVIRQSAWALSNLCRGAPLPKYEVIKPIIPVLCRTVVRDVLEGDELLDTLWAIASHSEGQRSKVQRIIEVQGFVKKAFELTCSGNLHKAAPCLRIIGSISAGNQNQTNTILKNDGLKVFEKMLDHNKSSIRREVCWIISNICAGSKRQVTEILNHPTLLLRVAILLGSDQLGVRRQICYIFGNLCHQGSPEIIFKLIIELKVLQNLICLICSNRQEKLLEAVLNCLYDLLFLGEKCGSPNKILKYIEQAPGCCQHLQLLQYHQSPQIYRLIVKIIQRFFQTEESNV